jgi:hypothetical protein
MITIRAGLVCSCRFPQMGVPLLRVPLEPVTDTLYRLYVFRLVRIFLDLGTQPIDMENAVCSYPPWLQPHT